MNNQLSRRDQATLALRFRRSPDAKVSHDMIDMLEHQQAQIDELTNHATSLVEFAKGCIETVFEGGSYDGGDMQDQLVRVGVLTQVEYNPEIHGHCEYGSEKGDPYFVMSDWFKQLKNGGEL